VLVAPLALLLTPGVPSALLPPAPLDIGAAPAEPLATAPPLDIAGDMLCTLLPATLGVVLPSSPPLLLPQAMATGVNVSKPDSNRFCARVFDLEAYSIMDSCCGMSDGVVHTQQRSVMRPIFVASSSHVGPKIRA